MSRKEYFAYGSNLNFEQMAYRCPEATVVGTAKLDGYELAFRRGYLTILPKECATVEGLIWSVTDHDESQLDCYEGYPTFYDKETMTVTDADGTPHEIMVYTMNAPYRDQLLPVSSHYNAVVLQGCLDAGISPQQFYDADEKYRKHRLTCYHSSAFIRRTGRQEAILPWAAFLAKPLTVFFLSARTPKKCSSALTATPQEAKPVPDWHSPFPARSPSFALSRQGKTGTMFSVSKGTFPAANS